MSRGISGGKQNMKFTNARNRGRNLFILSQRNDGLMVIENARF